VPARRWGLCRVVFGPWASGGPHVEALGVSFVGPSASPGPPGTWANLVLICNAHTFDPSLGVRVSCGSDALCLRGPVVGAT